MLKLKTLLRLYSCFYFQLQFNVTERIFFGIHEKSVDSLYIETRTQIFHFHAKFEPIRAETFRKILHDWKALSGSKQIKQLLRYLFG